MADVVIEPGFSRTKPKKSPPMRARINPGSNRCVSNGVAETSANFNPNLTAITSNSTNAFHSYDLFKIPFTIISYWPLEVCFRQ